jgi:hypothetical protein
MNNPDLDTKRWKDEIVEEVRSVREQLFADCDYDLEKLTDRLRQEEHARGRSSISFPKRAPSKESAV